LTPIIRRFNNHQEVQRPEEGSEKSRNVGKNLRVCSGRRGIRKWWEKAPGSPEKGPKIFEKIFLKKKECRRCVLRILTW